MGSSFAVKRPTDLRGTPAGPTRRAVVAHGSRRPGRDTRPRDGQGAQDTPHQRRPMPCHGVCTGGRQMPCGRMSQGRLSATGAVLGRGGRKAHCPLVCLGHPPTTSGPAVTVPGVCTGGAGSYARGGGAAESRVSGKWSGPSGDFGRPRVLGIPKTNTKGSDPDAMVAEPGRGGGGGLEVFRLLRPPPQTARGRRRGLGLGASPRRPAIEPKERIRFDVQTSDTQKAQGPAFRWGQRPSTASCLPFWPRSPKATKQLGPRWSLHRHENLYFRILRVQNAAEGGDWP